MKFVFRSLFIIPVVFLVAYGCGLVKSPGSRFATAVLSRVDLKPCQVNNIAGEARCGTYEVFEDRKAKTGRKIPLNIVVLPALSATPAPDPVFWLHGGPGAGATDTAAGAGFGYLAELRKQRDLVFIDQRGTGKSNPLKCDLGDDPNDLQTFFGDLLPRAKILECREKLEKIADLKLYTTPIAMDDLDEVRDALGYDKINVVGGSYGTIASQVYMRQHPDHIRAVLLGGVANMAVKQPLFFAKGAQHSLDRLIEDCNADEKCRADFPDFKKEFDAVIARFDKGPVTTELVNLTTKKKEMVNVTRGGFVEILRIMLYTAPGASFVPLLIHTAYQNDYVTFESLALRFNIGRVLARGMYMTVTCSESVPFITEQDIVRETSDTFVGDSRVRRHIEACRDWVKGDITKSYVEPVSSNLPVLLISGDLDASTPIWLGEDLIEHLSNGKQLKIRYYGHQLDGECIASIAAQFVDKATVNGLDYSCTEKIRRPPWITELPKQFSLQ